MIIMSLFLSDLNLLALYPVGKPVLDSIIKLPLSSKICSLEQPMSMYLTRQPPVLQDEPRTLPPDPYLALAHWFQVGTTPGPPHPRQVRGMSPNTPSMVNVSPVHHGPDLTIGGPLIEVDPSNVLRMYCSVTIGSDWGNIRRPLIHPTIVIKHPIEPLTREPPLGTQHPQPKGMPSTFMEPLSQMIHLRLETPCTPSAYAGTIHV